MPTVRLFRALRYDPGRVEMARVVCPPYDVISATEEPRYRAEPHNAIHLDKPEETPGTDADDARPDRYARAAQRLRHWQETGVLVRDEQPSLYLLEQRFRGPDGLERTRRGLIARLRLEDRGAVTPHELTNPGPRRDRLALLRATHTHLSQVFLLSNAGEAGLWHAAAGGDEVRPPVVVDDPDGTRHTLRTVSGPGAEEAVEGLSDHGLIIADGHHRFETALTYRDERRNAGDDSADWVMAYISAMDEPGLTIFPTHRLLRLGHSVGAETVLERTRDGFVITDDWRDDLTDPDALLGRLAKRAPAPVFGLVLPAGRRALLLELRDEEPLRRLIATGTDAAVARLGVTILHQVLLPRVAGIVAGTSEGTIDYYHRPAEAFARLREGAYDLGIFLNAPTMDDVRAVTASGETMPQKTTYFFPKLLTGLLFSPLDED